MKIETALLTYLKSTSGKMDNYLLPIDELKDKLSSRSTSPLFILELLDGIYNLESKGFVTSLTDPDTKTFCVKITDKGKNIA